MNKIQTKRQLRQLHTKIMTILKSEKNINYTGNDDDFSDQISIVYGDLGSVLSSIEDCI